MPDSPLRLKTLRPRCEKCMIRWADVHLQPRLPFSNSLPDDTCSICHDQYDNGKHAAFIITNVRGCVGHVFGLECIITWLVSDRNPDSCPMCRAKLFKYKTTSDSDYDYIERMASYTIYSMALSLGAEMLEQGAPSELVASTVREDDDTGGRHTADEATSGELAFSNAFRRMLRDTPHWVLREVQASSNRRRTARGDRNRAILIDRVICTSPPNIQRMLIGLNERRIARLNNSTRPLPPDPLDTWWDEMVSEMNGQITVRESGVALDGSDASDGNENTGDHRIFHSQPFLRDFINFNWNIYYTEDDNNDGTRNDEQGAMLFPEDLPDSDYADSDTDSHGNDDSATHTQLQRLREKIIARLMLVYLDLRYVKMTSDKATQTDLVLTTEGEAVTGDMRELEHNTMAEGEAGIEGISSSEKNTDVGVNDTAVKKASIGNDTVLPNAETSTKNMFGCVNSRRAVQVGLVVLVFAVGTIPAVAKMLDCRKVQM